MNLRTWALLILILSLVSGCKRPQHASGSKGGTSAAPQEKPGGEPEKPPDATVETNRKDEAPAPTPLPALAASRNELLARMQETPSPPDAAVAEPVLDVERESRCRDELRRQLGEPSPDPVKADPSRLETVSQLIEQNPRMARNYLERARIRAQSGDVTQAIEDCTLALEASDARSEAYVLRARLLMRAGNFRDALYDLDEALEGLGPKDLPSIHLDRARCKWFQGMTVEDVLGEIEQSLKQDEKGVEGLLLRSVVIEDSLRSSFSTPSADIMNRLLADYNTLLGLGPSAGGYVLRGLLQFKRHNWVEALYDANLAALVDTTRELPYGPDEAVAGATHQLVQASTEVEQDRAARSLGMVLVHAGRWEDALALLSGTEPRLAGRLTWLLALERKAGTANPERARVLAAVALPLWNALFSDAARGFGEDLVRVFDADGRRKARRALELCPESWRGSPAFRILQAEIHVHQGELEEAARLTREVLEAEPAYGPAHLLTLFIARARLADGGILDDAALEAARRALELAGGDGYAHLEAASVSVSRVPDQNVVDAWIGRAEALLGPNPAIVRVRLEAFGASGDADAFDVFWQKWREQAGDELRQETDSRLRRRWFEMAQDAGVSGGDLERAHEAVRMALRYEHFQPEVRKEAEDLERFVQGVILHKSGKHPEAAGLLEKVSPLDERVGLKTLYWLGFVYRSMSQDTRAVGAWEGYLQKSVGVESEATRRAEVERLLKEI